VPRIIGVQKTPLDKEAMDIRDDACDAFSLQDSSECIINRSNRDQQCCATRRGVKCRRNAIRGLKSCAQHIWFRLSDMSVSNMTRLVKEINRIPSRSNRRQYTQMLSKVTHFAPLVLASKLPDSIVHEIIPYSKDRLDTFASDGFISVSDLVRFAQRKESYLYIVIYDLLNGTVCTLISSVRGSDEDLYSDDYEGVDRQASYTIEYNGIQEDHHDPGHPYYGTGLYELMCIGNHDDTVFLRPDLDRCSNEFVNQHFQEGCYLQMYTNFRWFGLKQNTREQNPTPAARQSLDRLPRFQSWHGDIQPLFEDDSESTGHESTEDSDEELDQNCSNQQLYQFLLENLDTSSTADYISVVMYHGEEVRIMVSYPNPSNLEFDDDFEGVDNLGSYCMYFDNDGNNDPFSFQQHSNIHEQSLVGNHESEFSRGELNNALYKFVTGTGDEIESDNTICNSDLTQVYLHKHSKWYTLTTLDHLPQLTPNSGGRILAHGDHE